MPTVTSTFSRAPLALLVAGGAALLAIVATSLWLVGVIVSETTDLARSQETRRHALRFLVLLQDAETGQRGYLLTGEAQYLEPYERAREGVRGQLKRLEQALEEERQTGAADRLSGLLDSKMAELDETVALARSGRSADALALVRSDRGHQVMAEIRAVTDGIGAASHKRVLEEVAKLQSGAAVLRYVSLGGGLLIVIFVLGAAGATLRYMRDLIAARAEVHALNVDLERRVEARTAELTRANEEIQRFAYVVSHDLRAPLVNVMGFTSELEEGLSTLRGYFAAPQPEREVRDGAARHVVETEMPEAIGFIRSSTTKMDGLINAILRLSREGGRVLVPEPVDLGALIERQAAALRHQFEETGAKLSVPAKLPTIVSDRLALEQVFGNLIDNAVKYLAPERPGHITVRSFDQGSRVAVEIADNGRGIAPHDFDRIFELFRRSGAQDRSGEGIGLAHVRALVRRLGGEISVDSRLGEGSRFRVLLSKTLSVAPKGKAA